MTLNNAHVLITRPQHQSENLARIIEQNGGIAVRFPTIEIVPKLENDTISDLLYHLEEYEWVIFTSVNAVNFALHKNNGKIRKFKSARVAAIGASTAKALHMAGLVVDLIPVDGYNSEALLATADLQEVNGLSCLIVRGEGGREQLATALRKRGAIVDYLEVYKRIIPDCDSLPVVDLLTQNRLHVVTSTSSEALQNLVLMLGEENKKLLTRLPLVVISDRIRDIASEMGFGRIMVANSPSDTAILETVITCVTGEECGRIERTTSTKC